MSFITRYIKHPQYNSRNFDNDIALIQLDRRITFSNYIKPICLPTTTSEPAVGTKCFVTGFGRTQEGGQTSLTLRKAEVRNQKLCGLLSDQK